MKSEIKLAIVGDIHDQWDREDRIALEYLGVDLVLLVGDFGNEALDIVREIAAIALPFAAILGNHDAWYTTSPWGKRKPPYNPEKEDRVQQQLELLGENHVGYGKRNFPELGLSVVGGRPFSWGGCEWNSEGFYRDRFGVEGFRDSADRIVAAAKATTEQTTIFLSHNGPYGLGDRAEDICGRDWKPLGGDFGDPDLADAIACTQQLGKNIPLVTFGHMHHDLRHTRRQRRTVVCHREGTFYLNAAKTPRLLPQNGDIWRNFSLVLLREGKVAKISLVWVGGDRKIVSEEILYRVN